MQYPQRYQLVKVAGTEDIFDLIPAPGEVSAEGTLINKATLWKDATAALFGLGVDSVPDDGFAYLGKYAQHWWRRRRYSFGVDHKTVNVSTGDLENYYITKTSSLTTLITVKYSDGLEFDSSGGVLGLKEPISSVQISLQNVTTVGTVLKGKYLIRMNGESENGIMYVDPQANVTPYNNIQRYTYATKSELADNFNVIRVYDDWEFVQSPNRSAYPDSGEQDGYEYEYLGIPFDNAVGAPKIETGSYTGTGTYGLSSPSKLVFKTTPKLVVIHNGSTGTLGSQASLSFILFVKDVSSSRGCTITLEGTTLSWGTNSGAIDQMNELGKKYYYTAIG